MKPILNYSNLFALALVLFFTGCDRENSDLPAIENNAAGFSLKNAQSWYNSQPKSTANLFTRLQADWSKATFVTSNQENFLVIPLKASFKVAVNGNTGGPIQSQKLQLRIFKDNLNKLQGRIVQFESEQPYKSVGELLITDSFSGRIFFRSINDGKLLFGYHYVDGKVADKINPADGRARLAGEVCDCRRQYYFMNYCEKPGGQSGLADITSVGTSVNVDCGEIFTDYASLPTPSAVQEGYRCHGWELNFIDDYQQCHWVEDPMTGDPGTGTVGGSGSVDDAQFVNSYTINFATDPIKNRIFKLTGSIVVTNPCQHQALKAYLLKAQDLEIDYLNKIKQCGRDNNISGDAIQNLAVGLSFAAIAQYIAGNPGATFRTAARGLIYGQAINNLNAASCIAGVQDDIDAEIEKAYNAYSDAFGQPCP